MSRGGGYATPGAFRRALTDRLKALSAKSSMNRKRTIALMKSTIHSGGGITPSAPCVRSARALSRSERWSNHFE